MALSVDQAVRRAESLAAQGRTSEAEQIYRAIISRFPNNRRAQTALAKLAEPRPTAVPKSELDELHQLQKAGDLRQLITRGEMLASRHPRSAYLFNLIGIAHARLRELTSAEQCFARAIAVQPGFAEAHNNLGNTRRDQGRMNEAADAYRQAIALAPDQPEAHQNLGNILQVLGQEEEALASLERAIELKPDYVNAHFRRGLILMRQGRDEVAIGALQRTIALKPDHGEAHNNLANLLRAAGQDKAAMAHYRRAVELMPDNPIAHNNLGNMLNHIHRHAEAEACYRRAIDLAPNYIGARSHLLHLHSHVCDWDAMAEQAEWISRIGIEGDPVPPFALLAVEDHPARHRIRSERLAKAKYSRPTLPAAARPTHMPDKLRIGYFSSDFYNHATMYLMAGMFAHHDRDRFTIHAYSYGHAVDDEMRRRLIGAVDMFHDVRGLGDRTVAELARSEGIDVAIDLKGYTQGTRSAILAYRPAPVQISYIGYPGTMGAPFIDYIIADHVVIPERCRHGYSEQIIYMPDSYQANDDSRPIGRRPSRSELGLPKDAFLFACFNNNYKISAEAFDIWMRLLQRVEGSLLWLLRANRPAEANLRAQAARRGVDPDRLVFADKAPLPDHLARQTQADLFLDTFNYNAHTTASDALWAGLPIVTRAGESFASRVGASLLKAVGLPELITGTSADYERLALELATDRPRLAAIRARLETTGRTSPLFDTARFTRHMELAYHRAFELHVAGKPPQTIDLAA